MLKWMRLLRAYESCNFDLELLQRSPLEFDALRNGVISVTCGHKLLGLITPGLNLEHSHLSNREVLGWSATNMATRGSTKQVPNQIMVGCVAISKNTDMHKLRAMRVLLIIGSDMVFANGSQCALFENRQEA